ncbi:MAG: glycogen debranching protein GlgX, partial [Candidatus Omnitrophica bacterium]|nr:glycogen debranching protein GlgX [Candidatus Omnitrophota bacterium]
MKQTLHHHTQRKISSGRAVPLGATPMPSGVNFAVFSAHADEVFLLLFDSDAAAPTDCIKLFRAKDIWHVFVHSIGPGQLYAYKARGRYAPAKGMRFNEHKLLIDPYAKALTRKYRNDPSGRLYGYNPQSPKKDLVMDTRENMCKVPKCIVVDDAFDWQNEKQPAIPMEKLIIYEVHVKGLTQHRSSGVKNPGTYLGLVEKIPYLKSLGINCVELLPVQEFFIRQALIDNGLSEYWGYNTLAFFAPESSYASGCYPGCQINEFKTMVRQLHKAGIEVILDVVYNHTAEGNELGPTLSFKGLDNTAYYALRGTHLERYRSYVNHSGCGNTINAENPMVVKMVVDSLRYWAQIMHVDGFRFDLAPVLFRRKGVFHPNAAFYRLLLREPVLKHVKFIAEPWDMSTYQLGKFPRGWSEWNGKFRDTLRHFVKGEPGWIRETARRMTASADIYARVKRMPFNSVNFITCHDGFTLYDLFAYNTKHNELNAENNKDGSNDNHSWNCGTEGET